MSENYERPEDAPEFNAPDLPAFDPASLPGAQVIAEDDDFKAVAVPLSALDGLGEGGLAGLAGSLPPEVAELLGLGVPPEVKQLRTSFQQFKWATDELAKAKERHPETDPQVFEDNFVIVKPAVEHTEFLAPETLYRHHARELFDRLAAGEPTEKATKAEILGLLIDARQYVPFCDGLNSLYLGLAQEVTPEEVKQAEKETPLPEPIADFRARNAEDEENHRKELEEFLSHDRTATEKTPLPADEGEDMLEALASLAQTLGLPGLDG